MKLEHIGYVLLGVVAVCWGILLLAGLIAVLPWGLVGLAAIVGLGFLFAKVVKDRLANREDDYYERNVDK